MKTYLGNVMHVGERKETRYNITLVMVREGNI